MSKARLRGVNLGGWLVLERWITPSLFEGSEAKDEVSLLTEPGAAKRVERHRSEFVAEADFKWLVTHGINAIRLPVGYWILDGDGPLMAGSSYLDFAMKMAEKYQLKVLIDLHGAKGSQNGNDHSGRVGRAEWFMKREYREQTIEILVRLAERYKESPALWGIELLNEPTITIRRYFILRKFYNDAYKALSKVVRPGTQIVFSDAFMPRLLSGAIKARPMYPVVMDVHWYQFGAAKLDEYFSKLQQRKHLLERLEQRQPVIIGEWSGMLSHLTLKGMDKEAAEAAELNHLRVQMEVYSQTEGWFYWTYKTESEGIWNLRYLVESGHLSLDS